MTQQGYVLCIRCGRMQKKDGSEGECPCMDNPFSQATETLLYEAWNHLVDCGLVTEDDVELVNDGTWSSGDVIANVHKHYDGGWPQFVKDLEPIECWTLVHERRDDRGRLLGVTEKSNFGNTRYRGVV